MDHRIVDAQLTALIQRFIVMIPNGIREAGTKSQVAGSIFIKQGVIEQQAALANRTLLRNQCALAQIGCALVHGDHGVQQLLTLFCLGFHSLTALKAEGEILLKALGIASAAQITADICRDAGEAAIAGQVEMLGRAEILLLSLPLAMQILTVARDLLS